MNAWVLVFLIFNGNSFEGKHFQAARFATQAACEKAAAELRAAKPEGHPDAAAIGCLRIEAGGLRKG